MPLPTPSLPEDNARHFDPAPRELVGTILPLGVVPAFFDDAELSSDLPEYTPGGFPDGNAFPGAIDCSGGADAVLVPNARRLPLMVSAIDAERVLAKAWVINPTPSGWDAGNNFWVGGRMKRKALSRFILNAPDGLLVDHINGNRLDNRRGNLRLATPKQNSWNTRSGGGKSKYKGVCRASQAKTWRAYIINDGKQMHLGCFPDEIAAACAYDAAARRLFGEFACLNFPDNPASRSAACAHSSTTSAGDA